MNGTIVTVFQNGVNESRNSLVRDRYTYVTGVEEKQIKKVIWGELCKVQRAGHVLVYWNDGWWICEMKADLSGYTRIQIKYHPVIAKVLDKISA